MIVGRRDVTGGNFEGDTIGGNRLLYITVS